MWPEGKREEVGYIGGEGRGINGDRCGQKEREKIWVILEEK